MNHFGMKTKGSFHECALTLDKYALDSDLVVFSRLSGETSSLPRCIQMFHPHPDVFSEKKLKRQA
jgi:hypothetical protein